jgi:DNA repair exonuclease SbcCD ATPase subunit
VLRSRAPIALAAAAAVLVVLLVGGGLYARGEVAARDAQLAEARASETGLREQLGRLSAERDDLLKSREELRRERSDLSGQRDLLVAERETLNRRIADLERRDAEQQKRAADAEARAAGLERRVADAEKTLADRERELREAGQQGQRLERTLAERERQLREALTPSPTPAPTPAAPAKNPDLARLIELDDQIAAEFAVLLGHIDAVSQAFLRGNPAEISAAYNRGRESADRLKDLLARRAPVLDRLR